MKRASRSVLLLAVLLGLLACQHAADSDASHAGPGQRRAGADAGAVRDAPQPAEPADGSADARDASHDAGATIDVCGRKVAIATFTAPGGEFVFDAVTQAWVPYPAQPIAAAYLTDPLHDPRYDATRMPWIERDECTRDWCSFDIDAYRPGIFGSGVTDHALLVANPYLFGDDGTGSIGFPTLPNDAATTLRADVNEQLGGEPVTLAVAVMPNDRIELQIAAMDGWASRVAAWSLTPAWSSSYDGGYWLSDPDAMRTLEHGLALHVPVFMIDKGMSGSSHNRHTDPRDIGPAAKAFPDARLVVRHAAFEQGLEPSTGDADAGEPDAGLDWGPGVGPWPEGPYDEHDASLQALYPLTRGVNALIKSLRDQQVGPGENVYVSLDDVWAHLITRPTEAAHVLGKLLLYVGEDNILWASGSMLYGKPDPQVRAFRGFQIPADLRMRYGYPELTPERKAKILGLNAARLFCLTLP